ncbi:ABC transporter substrate-binding protein [Streptomyces sp. 4N509B]|uniref:ABC transporter substrate-binding protein n=1 Tax=Streptomyces sp. 4N509B TaxID=3457413 RepID=UPI003FD15208
MATLAAFGALLGLTSACSNSDAGDDNVITIFASQLAQMNLNTNSFTRELERKFDVDLRFETTSVEATAATEARQISLAGGDLPDAYMLVAWATQFNQSELLRYGQQGLLTPLNDLIEQHAPNIQAAFEEEPEFERFSTAPDGTIWGLPQWNDCYHCSYPYKFWINTEWLDNLGLSMPTTPEQFFDVMVAFKEDDPNGNGKADEIPLTGNTQNSLVPFIMNAFIYNAFNSGVVGQPVSLGLNGDTVQVQAAQEGWREGLRFLNRMWEADLIDPAAFSQGPDTMQATGNAAQGVTVGGMTGMHPGMLVTIGQEDGRDNQYDPMPPLTGPAGDPATYVMPSTPGATFVITNAASEAKQQKIMQIMDYIFSPEGHVRAQFGEEGIGWREPRAGEIALDQDLEPALVDLPLDEENEADYNGNWGPMSQVFDTETFRNTQVQPMDIYTEEGFERRLFDATELYEGKETDAMFPYWNVWIPLEDGSELSTLLTNVETYITTATAEFVTGVRDPDSDGDWQSYLDGLDGLGVDRYLEIWQNAYDAG